MMPTKVQEMQVLDERELIELNRVTRDLRAVQGAILSKCFPEASETQRREIVRGVAILYREREWPT